MREEELSHRSRNVRSSEFTKRLARQRRKYVEELGSGDRKSGTRALTQAGRVQPLSKVAGRVDHLILKAL